jgi:hypothetical protein
VRNLHCRDIVTPDLNIRAPPAFRVWFNAMMIGLDVTNTDDLYALLLMSCSSKLNQDWGVVDAVMGVRESVQGLRP